MMTEDKLRAAEKMIRDLSVCDGLLLVKRFYDRCGEYCLGDVEALKSYEDIPEIVPNMSTMFEYLSMRSSALRETFLDTKNVEQCALVDHASVVDLVRGWRVLGQRHPNANARETYTSLANGMCVALRARVGVPVDVNAEMLDLDGVRATLTIWYEQVMRTSQLSRSMDKKTTTSGGGIALVGRSSDLRVQIIKDFMMQGMAELSVLITAIGLGMTE